MTSSLYNDGHTGDRAGRQRGAVLVISLVMLVLVTLLGITAMQNSTMQERLAGNLWDRNKAFQAAEAGLRTGEGWLEATGLDPGVGVARRSAAEEHDELAQEQASLDPPRPVTAWDGSGAEPAVDDAADEYAALADLADSARLDEGAAPDFHVDPPAFVRLPGDINLNQSELECQRFYPVTSRSVGGTGSAVVILRSHYVPRQNGMVTCPDE